MDFGLIWRQENVVAGVGVGVNTLERSFTVSDLAKVRDSSHFLASFSHQARATSIC